MFFMPRKPDYIILNSDKVNQNTYTLSKSVDSGSSWSPVLKDVRKMWAPESTKSEMDLELDEIDAQPEPSARFLYAAHFADDEKKTIQLSVSDDGGNSFRKVHLPTVVPERVRLLIWL